MIAVSDYAELRHLMGGWFHQDFDLEGDTLEEVVAAYVEVVPPERRRVLVDDIERFLNEASNVDDDFERIFEPDVIPNTFAPTTRAFLERIAALAKP